MARVGAEGVGLTEGSCDEDFDLDKRGRKSDYRIRMIQCEHMHLSKLIYKYEKLLEYALIEVRHIE